jgi:hypothetical protein
MPDAKTKTDNQRSTTVVEEESQDQQPVILNFMNFIAFKSFSANFSKACSQAPPSRL